jgi:lysophospholipase L1-like esterase
MNKMRRAEAPCMATARLALFVAAIALPACSRVTGSPSIAPASENPAPASHADPPDVPAAPAPDSTATEPELAAEGDTPPATSCVAATQRATGPPVARMERFSSALHALDLGETGSTVRVLWLGDSHAAADYWPNAVRVRLQQRFGVGGPGFLHLGLAHYRHADAAVRRQGPWRVEPVPPATRTPQGDGIYGLAGIRTVPMASDSRVSVTLGAGAVRGRARWTVFARLDDEQSDLTVRLGATTRTLKREPAATGVNPLAVALVGDPSDSFVVESPRGRPRLFGAIVESEAGGVVVDTLGINGARVATALAWAQQPWVSAVAGRDPDLVIIEYGTNEVFDALAPERYEEQYAALVERITLASPGAACLLVGPTAVGRGGFGAQQRASHIESVQRAAADHLGCSFFSTALAMGGQNSFTHWSQLSPPLAARDGIHLTAAGYKVVGEAMADMLLAEYDRYVGGLGR